MEKEITIKSAKKQQNLMEWAEQVKECRSSGLSVNQWCKENGINLSTFFTRQKKVFECFKEQHLSESALNETELKSQFIELTPPKQELLPCTQAEIVSQKIIANVQIGKASVSLYSGITPAIAKSLLEVLKSC